MKKKVVFFLIMISTISYAQVGINTTNPQAALDVSSSTNGILIPRVALISLDNSSPVVNASGGALADATLVYNTATAGTGINAITPGFYYWSATSLKWIALAQSTVVPTGNNWSIVGNGGTNPSTNFIGTTDDTDLVFKRNGIKSGLIGSLNTAFGNSSLLNNTTGSNNTAIGSQSLYSNTTGYRNVANGFQSLYSNTEGFENVATGFQSLYSNTTGDGNVANGFQSLYSNTTGYQNVAIGSQSLYSNTSGYFNIANGFRSLYSNTTGGGNVANGFQSLYSNTEGFENVANGYQSLYSNTTGCRNVAVGDGSLRSNTTGNYNIAVGPSSLHENKIGTDNVANGYFSLFQSLSNRNVANGNYSLYSNRTGQNNVAVGTQSLHLNSTGSNNSALGYQSLFYNTTGSNNSALGNNAGSSLSNNVNNVICIGTNSGFATTTSNSVLIGDTNITSIAGQVSWSTFSDKRIKKNVKQNVPGLAFITKLTPVTYNIDTKEQLKIANEGFVPKEETPKSTENIEESTIEKITMSGFLAQDVEKTAQSIGYDFSGVDAPKNGKGLYMLRYSEFVVPLVKAIQEQQEMIEEQKNVNDLQQEKIENQEKANKLLQDRITELERKIDLLLKK